MAVQYPLNRDEWWAQMPIRSITLDPIEQVVADMTGGGEWVVDDVAPMMWQGAVTLGQMDDDERAHASAMIDLIRVAGGLFWAYDLRRPYPKADPRGVALGAAAPVVYALGSTRRELALSGLPAGYVLTRGDYLALTYDGGRRSLHRVLDEVVVAGETGITPLFQLTTLLPMRTQLGNAVALDRPSIPCLVQPGSIRSGQTRAAITDGFEFKFGQTMAVIA